jgi:hypothetical protein
MSRFWPILVGLLLAVAVAAVLRDEPPTSPPAAAAVTLEPSEPHALPSRGGDPAMLTARDIVTDAGLPLMPHDPEEPVAKGPVHPHPITPAHQRIYRENSLLHALNGAMDINDAAGMRRLLERYREDYPEDANELQEGYALIADCLEQPDAATLERARSYYANEIASPLRRYVRRHCFERAE